MKKKYQVFISSTYKDLIDERQSAMHTLLSADYIPAGMELFPPKGEEAWKVIESIIKDCDYYLLIIGARYGSIIEGRGISFTEAEYELAITQKIPVIPLILDITPDEIDLLPNDKKDVDSFGSADSIGKKKLLDFKEKIRAKKHPRSWKKIGELPQLILVGLNKAKEDYIQPGWLRGYKKSVLNTVNSSDYKNFKRRFEQLDKNMINEISKLKPLLDKFLILEENDKINLSSLTDTEKSQEKIADSLNITEKNNDGSLEIITIKHPWTIEELQSIIYAEKFELVNTQQTAPILKHPPSIAGWPTLNWWEPPFHNVLAHMVHICSEANAKHIVSGLINLSQNHPETLHLASQIIVTDPNLPLEIIQDLLRQKDF